MPKETGSVRGSDINNPIITTGQQGRMMLPRNLLDAISDIQQYYVVESNCKDIPVEFLTISRTIEFFKIGMKSGFVEGLTLVLLMPFFAFYLFPFVLESPDFGTKVIFGSMPYILVIINTALCCYIARYYVGKITRKAINSLLSGRTMSLLVKALLIYVFYLILHRVSTPDRVWEITRLFGALSERIYYGYLEILPKMIPVATESAAAMAVAAVVPYGMVYFLDLWTRYKSKKNMRSISAR